jgi:nucleotidyltransferase substrate binding protein (TIGR01987 family)
MTQLDLTSLEKALYQLKENHALSKDENHQYFEQFRSATVQAFEYTYDLGFKFIRRGLEQQEAATENIDHLSFRDLLRLAAERGLITDPKAWFDFREKRNITSHSYDEANANKVLKTASDLIVQIEFLLTALGERNDSRS